MFFRSIFVNVVVQVGNNDAEHIVRESVVDSGYHTSCVLSAALTEVILIEPQSCVSTHSQIPNTGETCI